MSNNLYLEAIEAAEEIKHAAEENVKQRLIESMTPQIKLLVEKKIFEKEEEILKDDGEVEEDCKIESVDENKINDVLIKNAQFTETLLRLRSIKEGINNLKKAKTLIEGDGNKVNENKKYVQLYKLLLSEVNKLKSNSIIKNNDDLLKQFYNINEEIHNMSKRRSYNELDHLLEMNLFEEEEADITDDEEEEDIDLESGDEGDEMPDVEVDEMPDVDEDQGDAEALQQIIDIAEKALDDSEDMGSEEEPEGDTEDDELQLDGLYEIDELANENEDDNLDAGLEESRRRDRVLEIDENMLRREIGKMKAIREGEAKDMASHFGGGSIEGEAFVDGVTLNKLHEVKIKAAKVVRKNRMLSSKLTQYKKALRGMKSQLSEMNLFNAKLLYANKLMQNRDLSMKQQRHIVESLDDANTIGEAKILFESLSKSLVSKRPATSGKNLSEGALRRKSGAASAPVRSGQSKPLNESVALDRWATLAGIKK
ncbi:MAG: hypothetical protein HOK65_07405 [Crocinitomicaceae bacterium]|nr:hypothetical protein [Crocinitomicaceae bacterium]